MDTSTTVTNRLRAVARTVNSEDCLSRCPRSGRRRRETYQELVSALANDVIPERPDRREPRVVKRRPKPYPGLICHRRHFRQISHKNRYYKNSRFGPKYRTNKGR